MFGLSSISWNVQRTVCLALTAAIVVTSLIGGAYVANHAAHPGYSVTITQLA
ncbi:hypothetical protein [Povalibacter sp.]|uniref:hypothetical protein n=1 Tax=Povalibacter sp. TaxID=1962978 RepID=UPI002F3F5E92